MRFTSLGLGMILILIYVGFWVVLKFWLCLLVRAGSWVCGFVDLLLFSVFLFVCFRFAGLFVGL